MRTKLIFWFSNFDIAWSEVGELVHLYGEGRIVPFCWRFGKLNFTYLGRLWRQSRWGCRSTRGFVYFGCHMSTSARLLRPLYYNYYYSQSRWAEVDIYDVYPRLLQLISLGAKFKNEALTKRYDSTLPYVCPQLWRERIQVWIQGPAYVILNYNAMCTFK